MVYIPAELEPFVVQLKQIVGEHTAARIWQTMAQPKRAAYWVNPLKKTDWITNDEVVEVDGCYSVAAGFRDEMISSAAATSGQIYPINPSSVVAARALAVAPGQEVLDLAAAPGGKTLLMAAQMGNRGRIAAVEPVKGRFHRMRANLQRCGVTNTQFYLADGRTIGRKVPDRFDRVLLDAPCSAQTRFRLSDPASYAHWKPRKVKECARKQRGLIRSAFRALKPEGLLLYCTCAFSVQENELVVNYLLENEPDAETVDLPAPSATSCRAIARWGRRELDPGVIRGWRILPDDLWDGFFLCLIRKKAASAVG